MPYYNGGYKGRKASPVTITKIATGEQTVVPAYTGWQLSKAIAPNKPVRLPIPAATAKAVWARDGLRCRYCGWGHSDSTKFELEHSIPVSKGGDNSMNNLVVACKRCNDRKGTKIWYPIPLREMRNWQRYVMKEIRRLKKVGATYQWKPDPRCFPGATPKTGMKPFPKPIRSAGPSLASMTRSE